MVTIFRSVVAFLLLGAALGPADAQYLDLGEGVSTGWYHSPSSVSYIGERKTVEHPVIIQKHRTAPERPLIRRSALRHAVPRPEIGAVRRPSAAPPPNRHGPRYEDPKRVQARRRVLTPAQVAIETVAPGNAPVRRNRNPEQTKAFALNGDLDFVWGFFDDVHLVAGVPQPRFPFPARGLNAAALAFLALADDSIGVAPPNASLQETLNAYWIRSARRRADLFADACVLSFRARAIPLAPINAGSFQPDGLSLVSFIRIGDLWMTWNHSGVRPDHPREMSLRIEDFYAIAHGQPDVAGVNSRVMTERERSDPTRFFHFISDAALAQNDELDALARALAMRREPTVVAAAVEIRRYLLESGFQIMPAKVVGAKQ